MRVRRHRLAGLALCLGVTAAAPTLASGEDAPVAVGLEYDTSGAGGTRISTRLERLATRDWQLGPLAIRPFARAIVEGGRVTVRRPFRADQEARRAAEPDASGPAEEAATVALHRLAEGLAGRELLEFRIRDFRFAVFRGDERQLALEAREARVEREDEALELRAIHADTAMGQRLEADRLRLRWNPERLEIRGPYQLCDGARCERGRGGELAFDPPSGRLVKAARPAPGSAESGDGEQRGER